MLTLIDLPLPHLPAALDGLRIAHLTDLHISRPRGRYRRVARLLAGQAYDLAFFTGDYMCWEGDEPAAFAVMRELCAQLHPRLGSFGVFGNHDTAKLRRLFTKLPIRWLDNTGHRLTDLPLELLGVETDRHRDPDSLALLADLDRRGAWPGPSPAGNGRPARLMLCHYPMYLPTAADLGLDVVFSGHTHGGQWRLPPRRALYTSSDLPNHLSAGILRQRDTLCLVSRGIGETWTPVRLFCPPQLPVVTLRRGPLPGEADEHVRNVAPW